MMTRPEVWAEMTDGQRYDALVRAELQRDNAELLLREQNGRAAAERQAALARSLRETSLARELQSSGTAA